MGDKEKGSYVLFYLRHPGGGIEKEFRVRA